VSARQLVPAAAILFLVVILAAAVWLLYETPSTLVNETPPRLGPSYQPGAVVVVHVGEGDSAAQTGEALERAGVIQSGQLFRVLASLMGVGDHLSPGDYEFAKGVTALTAVRRISQGITASNVVTVREGLRSEEIGELLEKNGAVSAADFRAALSDHYDEPFLASLDSSSLEGVLFPARYGFARDTTAHQAIDQMLQAFEQRYRDEIQPKLSAAPNGLTLSQVITLASIVEREARVPEERPIIASVFLNRLDAGIPLQADPTIQYALGSDPASVSEYGFWKTELSLADLAIDSPYNTYAYPGLPPGPISNPGLDSIRAVLEPADTNYLYFVARSNGSHAFAETLEEHQRNVCEIDPSRPEC
jgi:UPF0755 protein